MFLLPSFFSSSSCGSAFVPLPLFFFSPWVTFFQTIQIDNLLGSLLEPPTILQRERGRSLPFFFRHSSDRGTSPSSFDESVRTEDHLHFPLPFPPSFSGNEIKEEAESPSSSQLEKEEEGRSHLLLSPFLFFSGVAPL